MTSITPDEEPLQEAELFERLAEAEEDIRAGRVKDGFDVLKRLKEKHLPNG